jgi:hypothetical protein
VAVGTLSEIDGDTTVTLADEDAALHSAADLHKVFGGTIQTPKHELHVCTVLLEPILKIDVPSTEIAVEIWVNNDSEPNRICVLVKRDRAI